MAGIQHGTYITATWNNLVEGYMTSADWKDRLSSESTSTFSDGVASTTFLVNTGRYHTMRAIATSIANHKYYARYQSYGVDVGGFLMGIDVADKAQYGATQIANQWLVNAFIVIASNTSNNSYIYLPYVSYANTAPVGGVIKSRYPVCVDLTLMFGAGNEPNKTTFEAQCALNGINLDSMLEKDATGTQVRWRIA